MALDGADGGANLVVEVKELIVVGAGNDQCNGRYKADGTYVERTKFVQQNVKGGNPLEIWYAGVMTGAGWVMGVTGEHYYQSDKELFGQWHLANHQVASTARLPAPKVYPYSMMKSCMIWCGCA